MDAWIKGADGETSLRANARSRRHDIALFAIMLLLPAWFAFLAWRADQRDRQIAFGVATIVGLYIVERATVHVRQRRRRPLLTSDRRAYSSGRGCGSRGIWSNAPRP